MKTLIIGCGPGGEDWQSLHKRIQPDVTIVTNSAIRYTADVADYFVVVENLGTDPARDHPWILTETAATRICNSKTLRRLKEHHAGNWDDWHEYDRPPTPVIYPDSSVGTVLWYVLHMIDIGTLPGRDGEVHLCGFPLCFPDGVQHWTEERLPYRVGASHYMPPEVFVTVNGLPTIWQFLQAAAFVDLTPWPFTLINHSGGLLDIPGIGDLFSTDPPTKREYEV